MAARVGGLRDFGAKNGRLS